MKLLSIIAILMLSLPAGAQQNIIVPEKRIASSFAIIADEGTYNACKDAIHEYRDVLQSEGLATYVLYANWESPEHVKYFLNKYHVEQALEGAVFIGDIPIPMIRRAQHLTSAFKMDQQRQPIFDSSVPSDRFYDDFNLKFSFVKRDSIHKNLFYYNLRGDSPQRLSCSIYTGRIKQSKEGEEGYKQIRSYLKKVVAEHKAQNPLNRITSYTGDGSFSNSLSAWKDESTTLREQVPAAFTDSRDARFYVFCMQPFMKETIINELKRPDLDMMLFHEHGMPERQYLTGLAPAHTPDELLEEGKRQMRGYLRRQKDRNKDIEAVKAQLKKELGITDMWFEGAFDPKLIAADSIYELKTGIVLDDIPAIAPNARFVLFDACFNGDFRHKRFIANEYIFADGKTIACFANSVNVLQDKSACDLMGLLACGFRIGEWTKNVNILESHIIGDPTFRFARPDKLPNFRLTSQDTSYWKALLDHKHLPIDLQSLALYKLFELEYPQLSKLLYDTYCESNSYTQRLQCMHLLAFYNDGYFVELLKKAVNDPYEFIRRRATYYMGKVGRNDLIPYLADVYLENQLSERVAFNVTFAYDHVDTYLFAKQLKEAVGKSESIYDKEKFLANAMLSFESKERMMKNAWASIIDSQSPVKERLLSISMLRNNPYSSLVDDALVVLKNTKEPLEVRIALAESLGWYTLSFKKPQIIEACQHIVANEQNLDANLADELAKSLNRLKTYMR